MKRYFTKPRSWCDDDVYTDDPPLLSSITVHEDEGAINTGVLDESGEPIYYTNRIKMGFLP